MSSGDLAELDSGGGTDERAASSVLAELISLGHSNFDIFSLIRGLLGWQTRAAVAASCRLARAVSNAAVSTVQLSAYEQPLPCDMADVFPHAKVLKLFLEEDENGDPCDSLSAALRLEDWSTASPRLLARLRALTIQVTRDSLMDGEFLAEMFDLISRCASLQHCCTHMAQTRPLVN
jgi:hypothetical protein